MRKIFAIMGKASTGKDTLTKMLSEMLELPIALSFTTRPMRAGEKQGVEYNFISDSDFCSTVLMPSSPKYFLCFLHLLKLIVS